MQYSQERNREDEDTKDQVMEEFFVDGKLDLILSKLKDLRDKIEELNLAIKRLQTKVSHLSVHRFSAKELQIAFDEKFKHVQRTAHSLINKSKL